MVWYTTQIHYSKEPMRKESIFVSRCQIECRFQKKRARQMMETFACLFAFIVCSQAQLAVVAPEAAAYLSHAAL